MKSLYDILEISADATNAEIRTAYLARAKESHPDTGGSADAFSEVRLAYEVLSDDQRRKSYDLTGHVADVKDTVRTGAIAIVDGLIEILLQRGDASYSDAVAVMTADAGAALAAKTTTINGLEARKASIADLKGRFKPTVPNEMIIDELMDKKLAALQSMIDTERSAVAQLLEVVNILTHYEFAKKPAIDMSAFGPPIDELLDTSRGNVNKPPT